MILQLKKIWSFITLVCLVSASTISVSAQICAGGASACSVSETIDITNSSFTVIGSSQLALSTTTDYVALEGAAPPNNCGAAYINGYDELAGGTSIGITLNTPIAINPAVDPTVEYCFFFYNDSNISGTTPDPVNYANPLNITLQTNGGNITQTYPLTAADYVALEAGQWLFICQQFTLPGGATQITGMQQVLELEASVDGRCEPAAGGYSPANTCEVFAIAPDGISTCPVQILATCPMETIEDNSATICNGGLMAEITDWQTAVATTNASVVSDTNTSGTITYSSIVVDGTMVTTPDGTIADGSSSGCDIETETTYAYILCYGPDGTMATSDDNYILLGTHTLTVYPAFDAALLNITVGDCSTAPSVTSTCTNYTITLDNDADDIPAPPTPGQSGTNNYTITWTGAPTCWMSGTAMASYNCALSCPTVTVEDGSSSICNSGLTTEISDWQTAVAATNALLISDANTAGNVAYSSAIVDGTTVTAPDGVIADASHGGGCTEEIETTYAYLLCNGGDGMMGTVDDSYLLLGTYTLTVYPIPQVPTITISTPCSTAGGSCNYQVNFACTGDFEETTTVNGSTENGGFTQTDVMVTVDNAGDCPQTFTLAKPACFCPLNLSIADPCACYNGIDADGDPTNGNEYASETITITGGVPPFTVSNYSFLFDALGMPFASAADIEALIIGPNANGDYTISAYVQADGLTPYFIEITDNNGSMVSIGGGGVDCNCFLEPIPTLSQWGLITLALLLLVIGSLRMVTVCKVAFAGMGSIIPLPGNNNYRLPFNTSILRKSVYLTILLAIVGFMICFAIFGEIYNSDLIGVFLAGPIFAYLIHLLYLLETNKN